MGATPSASINSAEATLEKKQVINPGKWLLKPVYNSFTIHLALHGILTGPCFLI